VFEASKTAFSGRECILPNIFSSILTFWTAPFLFVKSVPISSATAAQWQPPLLSLYWLREQ
jgi:hypothetical protein